ncbi:MAG: 50S ribosomal protein L10 [Chloroflexi bacterium]|nr:50S ribosomal protein L10 [Chloroflexota bacterium]
MSREDKAEVIDQIQELFSRSKVGVLVDYRGLPTGELNTIRNKLGDANIQYKVVKNTLARIAARRSGRERIAGLFEGPVAVAFGFGEVTEPARVLLDHIRSTRSALSIKGGFMDGRPLSPADVALLSVLPGREVLVSQVMAGIQRPIVSLVSVLSNPVRGMMGVLQARINQLEGK